MPPPMPRSPSARALAAASMALAAVGFLRMAKVDLGPVAAGARIDQRYAGLARRLPANGPIGYLTDERFSAPIESVRFNQALYALSPRLLSLGDDRAPNVIADLVDPAELGRLCRDHGLEPVATWDDGRTALLRPRAAAR